MDFHHISVLLNETIDSLNIKENGIYVDGTLGGGGHSLEIVKRLGNSGRLIGLDQDDAAITAASERLKDYKEKITLVRTNYSNIEDTLKSLNIDFVDGIVLDLGVSSHQLDTPTRGFSYMEDAPLDMRMDRRSEQTAKSIVNTKSKEELARIFKLYGEERFANQIAKKIEIRRKEKPIETTYELNAVIKDAIPSKYLKNVGHPSKRVFQAIRIELNDELNVLEKVLPKMINLLKPKGRLSIITFHSLEDRIVKNIFKESEKPCTCPSNFPICVCGKVSLGKVITNKPILPSEIEIEKNRRSKSAKLRVFEKE